MLGVERLDRRGRRARLLAAALEQRREVVDLQPLPALAANSSARFGFFGSSQMKNSCVSRVFWCSSFGVLAFSPEMS